MADFNVANYLRISISDVIMVFISTMLIILFAKHFFWDKILVFIQKRQDLIQSNIDESVELKNEAQAQKDKYDEKLKSAGQEAHVILETARADATKQKDKILDQAQVEAGRIKERAQEEMAREQRRANLEMQNAISDVAIEAAKKLVDKEMDGSTQRKFVDDFIRQAGDKEW